MDKISFVIPVPYGYYPTKTIKQIQSQNYPLEDIEIIIAEGFRPSLQRNLAVEQANGEFIYFLDDDSFIAEESVRHGLRYLREDNVAAVGGPALTHSEATFLEACFGEVTASFWGTFVTRARNKPVGSARRVRGEELILCNMMFKKEIFLEMSGLNENLYPNEENELLKRMRKSGHSFYYVPEMIVHRTRRSSVTAFAKQIFRYGLGRTKHIFPQFSCKDAPFIVPTLYGPYLLTLLFFHPTWFLVPLGLHFILSLFSSLIIVAKNRKPVMLPLLVLLFTLVHVSYGAGFLVGLILLKSIKRKRMGTVRVTKIETEPAEEELRYGFG